MRILRIIAQPVSGLFASAPDSRAHFSRKRDEYSEEPAGMVADKMDGFEHHNGDNRR